jgi:predicted nucleotidyltransferase
MKIKFDSKKTVKINGKDQIETVRQVKKTYSPEAVLKQIQNIDKDILKFQAIKLELQNLYESLTK